jgi:hypothetical protein
MVEDAPTPPPLIVSQLEFFRLAMKIWQPTHGEAHCRLVRKSFAPIIIIIARKDPTEDEAFRPT